MSDTAVQFHDNGAEFIPKNQMVLADWIHRVIAGNDRKCTSINFVFCTDTALLEKNRRYLQHNYFTDVITFDNSIDDSICGDVFISIDRVRENAKTYGVPFEHELHRIMVHGILHLLGFNDKTPEQRTVIREREDYWLSLLTSQENS